MYCAHETAKDFKHNAVVQILKGCWVAGVHELIKVIVLKVPAVCPPREVSLPELVVRLIEHA